MSNLSEVKPYKSGWRVAVKVIHTWVSFSHQYGASLEMVLADKNGIKIHAICKQSLMERFERQCGVESGNIIQSARKEVSNLVFTLRDSNDHRLQCCISGRLADLLNQEGKPKSGDICLIRFAKIVKCNDQWRIVNAFHYTLVFINPDIKEAESLKQKLHGDATTFEKNQNICAKLQIQEKRQRWSQNPFITIQEMKHFEKGGNCRVICSVYAIDTLNGWWFCACVVCQNKVVKSPVCFAESDVQMWWCEFCHSNVTHVYPRYKLDCLVQDQTGESKITLLDSVATYIVKKSAKKLVNVLFDEIEVQDMLPPEIVDIVGKSYGFGISIDGNNSSVLVTFNAMKVWSLTDAIWKRTKFLHQNSIASRKKQCKVLKIVDESG
ncbi:uncharacterized protein LOC108836063 [Raphanus sativus]|uniref:Uncharacterized protein LOC108836063 n=1 Tax=Raphanus sativus TaxID=3726 RepID=A0A9W3BUR7_RAPSA|nr:uncharacterized protein LOC108836063 [Raphanus sativus]